MSSRSRSSSQSSSDRDSAIGDEELPDVQEIIKNPRRHATAAVAAPELAADHTVELAKLDEDQRKVVQLVLGCRAHTFVVGRAGTGKSTVIETLCGEGRKAGLRMRLAAPSGTTALNIGGETIHAFMGLGLQQNYGLDHYKLNAKKPGIKGRLEATDILIIDEISMMSSDMLERLDGIMKSGRGSNLPFGGCQIVLIGDPCQLPPVKPFEYCLHCGKKREDRKVGIWACPDHGSVHIDQQWVWKARAFRAVDFKFVELRISHRQQEPEFQTILDIVYRGEDLSDDHVARLRNRFDEEGVVKLFAHTRDVDSCNDEHFAELEGPEVNYTCHDEFRWNQTHEALRELRRRSRDGTLVHLGQHKYESKLLLKEGMPVMLLRNLDTGKGLVNGSQGIIVGWKKYRESDLHRRTDNPSDPDVDCETPKPASVVGALPAYGGTLSNLRLDQCKTFMRKNRRSKVIPIVQFHNGITSPIIPDCSIVEYGFEQPRTLLMRTQLPISAAWAMTIHKAQGMTLGKVIGDASKLWAHGMLYVLLSRTRLMSDLCVTGLKKCRNTSRDHEVEIFLRGIDWE